MLRMLIADDEYFTLENISQRIPWKEMNIAEVLTAEDGVCALDLAQEFKPDILLTDVRMPRMNGILLSTKLRELYPDICIIFMSGYSDKEYLKSAIDLKAFGYIEKPLKMEEVQSTIQKTVCQLLENRSKQQVLSELAQKYDDAFPVLRKELALKLTKPGFGTSSISRSLTSMLGDVDKSIPCFTILVDINPNTIRNTPSSEALLGIIQNWMSQSGLDGIYGIKDSFLIIVHLYNQTKAIPQSYNKEFESLWNLISEYFNTTQGIHITVGDVNNGFANLYHSYNKAILAQQDFFFDQNLRMSYYNYNNQKGYAFDETRLNDFLQVLLIPEKEKAILQLQKLTETIRNYKNTPIRSVKGIYYKMLLQVVTAAEKYELSLFSDTEDSDYILEAIYSCHMLDELAALLMNKTQLYYDLLSKNNLQKDIIYTIKSFIEANYTNPELSLKKISEFCFLSEAHLCVVFKEATGQTLNQFITEYRIKKAKEYLQYQNIKISDVAEKVGFVDGNYFAKTFRKVTGTSPSKFRENYLLCLKKD